ncbi:FAD-binding oxidoreductase, partial [Burkholderia pseudomallei]|uniref:NAD(P)/FAD-dependent oxidoreductase n=1 Tax=Burkholderia pseudomallei TaxID=28450 RepID=UPI0021F69F1A
GEPGVNCGFERPRCIERCEHGDELASATALLASLHRQDAALSYEVLDAAALRKRLPAASPSLAGTLWSPNDGHANPLYALRAMLQAFVQNGGVYLPRNDVNEIRPRAGRFEIDTCEGRLEAGRVVLAAGLDNARLAPMVDMHAPISALRGRIMVTERPAPVLTYPAPDPYSTLRAHRPL